MFAQISFFVLLSAIALSFLAYKTASSHLPVLNRPWWSYRFTVVVLGIACWLFIYQDAWGIPLALFLIDYGFFILTRYRSLPKWSAVLLTLMPLLLIKSQVLSFISILGLSFMTFRAIDALLMNDPADSADIGEYFFYVFFPPAILAGPMYRWRDFRSQLAVAYESLSLATFLDGWEFLILGIVQKFAIAQLIDVCLLQRIAPDDYSFQGVVANATGYSVFLYFDFAGYSNMAIGAARVFGFTLPENFKNPIASANPQDFWKRWHVSLSEWLRDVVFTPMYKYLVSKGGFSAQKLQAQDICILATLLIMGTWNGFERRYICSGFMFGLYSVAHNRLNHAARVNLTFRVFFMNRYTQAAVRVLTIVLVVLALYVFGGRSPIG